MPLGLLPTSSCYFLIFNVIISNLLTLYSTGVASRLRLRRAVQLLLKILLHLLPVLLCPLLAMLKLAHERILLLLFQLVCEDDADGAALKVLQHATSVQVHENGLLDAERIEFLFEDLVNQQLHDNSLNRLLRKLFKTTEE